MTAAPPPSRGDNEPPGPGPAFEPPPGRYGVSSGPSANAPAGPPDAAPYGQRAPGYGTPQPSPASYGTPAQGPYAGNQGDTDPYAPQSQAGPSAEPPGYGGQYAGNQGYPDPSRPPYAPTQGYTDPAYAPAQRYVDLAYAGQGYAQPGGYPGYAMAPMAMGAPLPTGLAVAAMVCGIVGVVLSLCGGWSIPLSIIGIVLGAIGVQKANRGDAGGRSMAIAGIVTGAVGAAISMSVILIYVIAVIARQ